MKWSYSKIHNSQLVDCPFRVYEKSLFFLIIKKLMKATEYRGMISSSTSARLLSPSCLHYVAGTGRSWLGHQKNLTTLLKVCIIHVQQYGSILQHSTNSSIMLHSLPLSSTFKDHKLTNPSCLHTTHGMMWPSRPELIPVSLARND